MARIIETAPENRLPGPRGNVMCLSPAARVKTSILYGQIRAVHPEIRRRYARVIFRPVWITAATDHRRC